MGLACNDAPTARTLLVTIESDSEFYARGLEAIERLERDEPIDEPDTFSFPSAERLFETFDARTMGLLETVSEQEPPSIRETARLVDRDVKNVHQKLTELERLGLIRLEMDGRSKRPVFPYDEIVIDLPFGHDPSHDTASA
jgi:predicted transcriptional regulator